MDRLKSLVNDLEASSAGSGPSDPSWARALSLFARCVTHLDNRKLRLENDSLRGGSGSGSSAPSALDVSHLSSTTLSSLKVDKVIIQGLPVFDGTNFDKWLDHFENVVVTQTGADLPQIKKILAVKLGPNFSGMSRTLQDRATWAQVKETLVAEFSSTPGDLEMALSWQKLQQGDAPLRDYNATVLHMLHRTQGTHAPCYDTCSRLLLTSLVSTTTT